MYINYIYEFTYNSYNLKPINHIIRLEINVQLHFYNTNIIY